MKKILTIILGIIFSSSIAQNLTSTENYIYKKTYLSDPSDPVQKQLETVQYLDGLGRPKQVISIKSTPTGQDLVIPVVYDQFGRKTKDYLPIPVSTSNAGIQNSVSENTVNSYYGVTNAFSEKELESSPLSRIFQSASPGEDWKMSSGHTVKYTYDANSTADQVKKYQITTIWDNINQMYVSNSPQIAFYAENSLYKFTVKDEDNNEKIVFKDLYGHIVLIRKNDGNNNLDTYYVYDKYDQLAYVIPPSASAQSILTQTTLDNLCYQYRFDNKKRAVEKKLPGKGWEYMVYDKADRLIMTQDANMKPSGKWLFTKYDQFSRVTYTGIAYIGAFSREQVQSSADYFINQGQPATEGRNATGFTNSGMTIYYTNAVYPSGGYYDKILSVNYYDTYPSYSFNPSFPSSILGQTVLTDNSTGNNTSTKSLPIMTLVKNIEDDNWTKNYTYYDTKGRAIGTHSINYLGGYTRTESIVDFTGVVKHTNTYHKRLNTDQEILLKDGYEYDHQNRLIRHWHLVNNNTPELLAENIYDELSQLKTKKVGGANGVSPLQTIDYTYNIRGWMTQINDPANLGNDLFGYKINYNQVEGLESPNSDFPSLMVKPKYNGNIAEVSWKTLTQENEPLKRYGYVYDELNRLSAGFYQKAGYETAKEYFEKLDYDLNGNITRLQRSAELLSGNTTALAIDNLKYDYVGNRLTKVTEEQIGNSNGYPYLTTHNTIEYDNGNPDGNGNMTSHLDKGISSIQYNYLDLPKQITQNSKVTNYTYRADGSKVKKFFGDLETDYLDGFQYKSTYPSEIGAGGGIVIVDPNEVPEIKLRIIPTSEGYYDALSNLYVYNFTDHLGNVRLSYTDTNQDGVVQPRDYRVVQCTGGSDPFTDPMMCIDYWKPGEIVEVNNYYPFGMLHNYTVTSQNAYQYKYQGQELQETGFYSFKWRNYMPDIGRFFNIDPLSEIYAYQSHYNFSENRVIDAWEIEGLEAETINKENEWASFGGRAFDGGLESITTYTDGTKEANIKTVELNSSYKTPDSGFGWGDAARVGVSFVPFVGSGLDIYEGARDGNWVQLGFGIGGMALDIVTLGSGSIVKGGVKTIGTHLVEEGMEKATKEVAEAEMRILSKSEMSTVMGAGSDANVVRGGTCLACQFENGSGVTVGADGLLNGVSVNSVEGLSVKELSTGIPNGKIGTTTVSQIEALGGKVTSSPTKNNPYHSTLSGITAEQAEKLFNPTIKNPTK